MKKSFLFFLLYFLIVNIAAEPLKVYHVGNSLTNGVLVPMRSDALEDPAAQFTQGFHIAYGRGLHFIGNNPNFTHLVPPSPFGKWKEAFEGFEWDAVTIQAYPGGSVSAEITATKNMISVLTSGDRNKDCQIFLYHAWPQISEEKSFQELIDLPLSPGDSSFILSKAFLDHWYTEVKDAFPLLDIRIIPTGLAMAAMEAKYESFGVEAYNQTYDLYRDDDHLNRTDGGHFIVASMLASLKGKPPEVSDFSPSYIASLDPNFVFLSHQVISWTLKNDPRTTVPKQEAPLEIDFRKTDKAVVCSFTGKLYRSHHLNDWIEVVGATSPHIFTGDNPPRYFRTVTE